eukprot:3523744-Alexandrium_andersonii.AAC.1
MRGSEEGHQQDLQVNGGQRLQKEPGGAGPARHSKPRAARRKGKRCTTLPARGQQETQGDRDRSLSLIHI